LESLDVESSFSGLRVHLEEIRAKVAYEGHQVKVKVTGAKKTEILYSRICKTSISNNSGSLED